jgi:DNA-binding response OmpR family regulator
MNRTLLIVDNDQDFLDGRAEALGKAGYKVVKANSLEQAEQLLRSEWIHVVIIDVRMQRETDEKDISGINFARKAEFGAIPKIILTRFPSYTSVRAALGPAMDGMPPAVDFVAKQDGLEAMLQAVEQAFEQHVHINWDIEIRWREDVPFHLAGLVDLINPDLEPTQLHNRMNEIQGLFGQLFYDCTCIVISRYLWHKTGRVALEVIACDDTHAQEFLVTCGRVELIVRERARFEEYAPRVHAAAGTSVTLVAQTRHTGAVARARVAMELEEMQTLSDFFRGNTDSRIRAVLERLFNTEVAAWHDGRRFIDQKESLAAVCRKRWGILPSIIPPEVFARMMERLSEAATAYDLAGLSVKSDQLVWRFPNGQTETFPNPVTLLYDDGRLPDYSSLSAPTSGGLDLQTVLVSLTGETWLTDYSESGVLPIWHDFVGLERSIRHDFVKPDNLITLWHFEESLLMGEGLSDTLPSAEVEPIYRKAFNAIQTIRRLAADAAGDNDPLPYFLCLLFSIAQDVATQEPFLNVGKRQVISRLQDLLLVTTLCRKLTSPERRAGETSESSAPDLRIDEGKHDVWIRSRKVHLTPTEFKLLLYLYRRAGQLCKRSDIARDVFSFTDAGPEAERNLVNTSISRLRKKIERAGKEPDLILTIRGEGYKLVLPSDSRRRR